MNKRILLITGEESGDVYAGKLIHHLTKMLPGVEIDGIGGPRCRTAGMNTFFDISQMASIGVASMLRRLRFFLMVLGEIKNRVSDGNYDAVILIDYPDFNMRVAKTANVASIPVYYYVCPQFWAWRRYRLRAVRKYIDQMLVVFPFEEDYYLRHGINAKFVGHPLCDEFEQIQDRDSLRQQFGAEPSQTVLGLFPGSRQSEINRMLPLMLKAAKLIQHQKKVKVLIACPRSIDLKFIQNHINDPEETISIAHDRSWEVMSACDYLICKSGTSTLQATISGCPMQIVYKSDLFSYILAKSLVYIKYSGLPNLLASKEFIPELLQWNMTPKAMANVALDYLSDPKKMYVMKENLEKVKRSLGKSGASERAALNIIEHLKK